MLEKLFTSFSLSSFFGRPRRDGVDDVLAFLAGGGVVTVGVAGPFTLERVRRFPSNSTLPPILLIISSLSALARSNVVVFLLDGVRFV